MYENDSGSFRLCKDAVGLSFILCMVARSCVWLWVENCYSVVDQIAV